MSTDIDVPAYVHGGTADPWFDIPDHIDRAFVVVTDYAESDAYMIVAQPIDGMIEIHMDEAGSIIRRTHPDSWRLYMMFGGVVWAGVEY